MYVWVLGASGHSGGMFTKQLTSGGAHNLPSQQYNERVAWEEIGQDENVSVGDDECHRYQEDLLAVHSNCKETVVLWEEGGAGLGPLVFL